MTIRPMRALQFTRTIGGGAKRNTMRGASTKGAGTGLASAGWSGRPPEVKKGEPLLARLFNHEYLPPSMNKLLGESSHWKPRSDRMTE